MVSVDLLFSLFSNTQEDARQPEMSGLFAFLGYAFAQIIGQIVYIRVKTLCGTNLVASRHIKSEKTLLTVDVSGSKRLC